jgi:hypothetical protein
MKNVLFDLEFKMIHAGMRQFLENRLFGGNKSGFERRTIFPRGVEKVSGGGRGSHGRREKRTGNKDQAEEEKGCE